jgi:hypothetical protein
MGIGSGLGGSLGVAVESVYGTYVAPTRFHEVNKANLKKVKNTAQGGGLAAGRFAQLGSRRVVTTMAGGGSVEMEVPNKGFGIILNHLFGGTVTPVQQGATAAYLQTHPIADNIGKFLTVQSGIPDTTGNVRPYSFIGSKITAIEFSCGVDELLIAKIDVDCRDVSEAQGLASVSYIAGQAPRHFGQMGVKFGTFGAEAAVQGIRKVTLKISRGQAMDRFYANNLGLKSEPIMNDYVNVTGTFDADFVDKTILADRFAADSPTSLVWELIGPNIASTFFETFRIRVPQIFLDGDTPDLDGPGIVSGSFAFTGQFDGTNPFVSAEYMSTDITL